jgi:hypothetical protein
MASAPPWGKCTPWGGLLAFTSGERREVWREICEAIPAQRLPAYILNYNRESHDADHAQFAALLDRDPLDLSTHEHGFVSTMTFRKISSHPHLALTLDGMTMLPRVSQSEHRVEGQLFFLKGNLEAVFGAAGSPEQSSLDASGKKQSAGEPRGKSSPALESAQRAIEELYPGFVPSQATERNAILCRKVSAKIKEAGLPEVSDDTILRAAGRRK